jgi:thiamine biosynthesis lipoprotein
MISGPAAFTHLEPVMGTVVGITSPDAVPRDAVASAVGVLHQADRIFSTWNPDSPMSRLRSGQISLDQLPASEAALIEQVLQRCSLAREITAGAFDPWRMPGGVDPTGLVKGWAAARALQALTERSAAAVMLNAGGDIAVAGLPAGQPWRIGIRHPAQPTALAAVGEVTAAIATTGDYERPGHLINPATGRTARRAASATVTGPDLDLADALATGLAVAGHSLLTSIDELPGYDAYLISPDGRHYATPGVSFARQ